MEEIKFEGYNGYPLTVCVWDEVSKPNCVMILSHGMVEHMRRYDDFANFLNTQGVVVVGDDHRGHGKTCGLDKLGIVPDGDSFWDTVEDGIVLTDWAKEKYNLPIILFGHSYGSFLSQAYLELASEKIEACILCGSAKQDGIDVAAGRLVANLQFAFGGKDKPAKLIKKLSFDGYCKKFKEEKDKEACWINRDEQEREKYIHDPMSNYVASVGFYKYFFNGLKEIYRKENLEHIRKDIPIFVISGGQDPVGRNGESVNDLYEMYRNLGVDNVKVKLYAGARHEILNELNKKEVYQDVIEFVNKIVKK
ncbi:MAG: alpha/beta hydrolase [Clostridia bacterium]